VEGIFVLLSGVGKSVDPPITPEFTVNSRDAGTTRGPSRSEIQKGKESLLREEIRSSISIVARFP
jgi:hypothetical protein